MSLKDPCRPENFLDGASQILQLKTDKALTDKFILSFDKLCPSASVKTILPVLRCSMVPNLISLTPKMIRSDLTDENRQFPDVLTLIRFNRRTYECMGLSWYLDFVYTQSDVLKSGKVNKYLKLSNTWTVRSSWLFAPSYSLGSVPSFSINWTVFHTPTNSHVSFVILPFSKFLYRVNLMNWIPLPRRIISRPNFAFST